MFRIKKSVPLSYERQGYIYFASKMYKYLGAPEQKKIIELCRRSGGENWKALFEFVTTDAGAVAVCMRHNIASETTIHRMVRDYYMNFPQRL